mgnify:CR=1 FL=1
MNTGFSVALDSYTVPAGSTFLIAAVHMNKREDIWSDPLTFNPDRFLSQNDTLRHKCAYVPFSYGPRNCIGTYDREGEAKLISTILNEKSRCQIFEQKSELTYAFLLF